MIRRRLNARPARWAKVGLVGLLLTSAATLAASAPRGPEAQPVFVPPAGTFTNQVTVHLKAPTPETVVRFTLDGTEPTLAAPVCSNAITLTNCALVRARVFDAQGPVGPVVSQAYLVLEPALAGFDSNLPLIVLDSAGAEVPFALRVPALVRVIEPGAGGRAALTSAATFDGRALICLRGRSSLRYPKRSFNLRLIDELGDLIKAPLLGLPADWDWVLYAPFPDKTLMRDVLACEWSRQMGRYASRTRFVEVFVNESGTRLRPEDYRGVYVLMEKVKQGRHRVNIDALGPGDLTEPQVTGGYIFKKDHPDIFEPGPVEANGFREGGGGTSGPRFGFPTGPGGFPADPAGFLPAWTGRDRESRSEGRWARANRSPGGPMTNRIGTPLPADGKSVGPARLVREDEFRRPPALEGWTTRLTTNQFYFVDPAPDELNPVQRAWLMGYVDALEQALYGPEFRDPVRGYAAYLDPDSFIDYHLLVEVTKNVDGFRFSTFYHKDRNGRLQMGPIWDWNLSLGNATGKQGWNPQYWLWPQLDDQEYTWFRRLFEDPDFAQRYVDRWAQLRRTIWATSNVLAQIDALAQLLDEAQKRNFQRWPILGVKVPPNYYVGQTYADEVNWMKEWTATRLAWIDKQFLPPPHISLQDGRLHLQAPTGTIYFSLDGTDPRAPGGQPSAQAKAYTEPIPIQPSLRLVARTRLDNRWSAPTHYDGTEVNAGSKAADSR